MKRNSVIFLLLVVVTTVNSAYLEAFNSATIFYHANVIAHVVLGFMMIAGLLWGASKFVRGNREKAPEGRSLLVLYSLTAVVMSATGVWLTKVGTSRPFTRYLLTHEAAAFGFLLLFALLAARRMPRSFYSRAAAAMLLVAILVPASVRLYHKVYPPAVVKIVNPPLPPMTAYDEGGGKDSPFFPSSNKTVTGKLIPSDFFLESKACGNKGCHPDITTQWETSSHHFSSFNNQWYRKSIEYMQDVNGVESSKWCGGCHDMAVLLTGRMDTPIREQIDTPESQAGIGCLVCHSITNVSDTMGQGGFVFEYPEMHKLVASKNPVLEFLHDRMLMLDPGPHRETMLKPFHRESTPEFCSACHKVHLDFPVNNYRWFRGFNDYDAWQGSGVSGQGARSFYYPPQPMHCGNCHMPLVESNDKGNIGGKVHDHRFPAANTALPTANGNLEQLELVKKFLQNGILTVDIFAVSEEGSAQASPGGGEDAGGREIARKLPGGEEPAPVAQSMMPDEGGFGGGMGPGIVAPPRQVIAPVDKASIGARPGTTVRVDVVARTRKIGHFFPAGTVDAFDVWLELKAEDADGKVLYWNGWIADDGNGPVDPGAHFYKNVLVDENGNRINKRNAWAARAVAYVRLIPPGAADTAHYNLRLPADVKGPVKLTARMNYRKFSWWNTQWAFAGERDPEQTDYALDKGRDDGHWVFTADTSSVSGKTKSIPDVPVVVIAEDTKILAIGGDPEVPESDVIDRERWNDYGIGLLLQGDLKSADLAFEKVTELEPSYADGWVNRARVAVNEGDHARALELLDKALEVAPDLASAHYFRGVALRSFGRYDDSLAELRKASEAFPRDKVVLNAIGRLLFLQRKFADAVEVYKTTLAIDPENLMAHYNLMLCYRGLRDEEMAKTHEAFYLRFKADESSQSLTQKFRLLNPDDNRERQAVHAHDSTWTPENLEAASGRNYGVPGLPDAASGPAPQLASGAPSDAVSPGQGPPGADRKTRALAAAGKKKGKDNTAPATPGAGSGGGTPAVGGF